SGPRATTARPNGCSSASSCWGCWDSCATASCGGWRKDCCGATPSRSDSANRAMTRCDEHVWETNVTTIIRVCFFLAVASAALLRPAIAEQFPTRVVRLVVPFPAGGGVDVLARAIAERLSKTWGQTVVIDNKAGSRSIIGGEGDASTYPGAC